MVRSMLICSVFIKPNKAVTQARVLYKIYTHDSYMIHTVAILLYSMPDEYDILVITKI